MDEVVEVGLDRLLGHPGNSNVMGEALLGKLVEQIRVTGRYPPLVVRVSDVAPGLPGEGGGATRDCASLRHGLGGAASGSGEGRGARGVSPGKPGAMYEVLDGHQRWEALRRLGHDRAACVVWAVDDEGALVLLATLNRLRGRDDPHRRAAMIGELHRRFGRSAAELGRRLPETSKEVGKYLALGKPMVRPRPAKALGEMVTAVHFFLTGEQKRKLDGALRRMGGTREEALMGMVRGLGERD